MSSPFFRTPDLHRLTHHPLYKYILGYTGEFDKEGAYEFCKVFSLWEDCELERWVGHPREQNILSTAILRCLNFQSSMLLSGLPRKETSIGTCSICLEHISTIHADLECGHKYHPWCLMNWKMCAQFSTCPDCGMAFNHPASQLCHVETCGFKYPTVFYNNAAEEYHLAYSLKRVSNRVVNSDGSVTNDPYPYHCIERSNSEGKLYYTVPARIFLALKYYLLSIRKQIRKKKKEMNRLENAVSHFVKDDIYANSRKKMPTVFIAQFVQTVFKISSARFDYEYIEENKYFILLLLYKWWIVCGELVMCSQNDFPTEEIFPCSLITESVLTESDIDNYMENEDEEYEVLTAGGFCDKMSHNEYGWRSKTWTTLKSCIQNNRVTGNLLEMYKTLLMHISGYTIKINSTSDSTSRLVSVSRDIPSRHMIQLTEPEIDAMVDIEDTILSNMKPTLRELYETISSEVYETISDDRLLLRTVENVRSLVNDAIQWTVISHSNEDPLVFDQLKVSRYIVHKILNKRIRVY